jgi:L,D-peptidoglycan transpeptidase YkuD (ErfK/YbiS/YcfS/YnhG family)
MVLVERRVLLQLPLQLMAVDLAREAQAGFVSLEYRDGRLRWSGASAPAAVGRGGISSSKREGDGATPAGTYSLALGFYRKDRLARPRSGLPMRALAPQDAWVDDPADANYNRLVSLPYRARTEPMWRRDEIYDVVVVISYNMNPVVPGAGSAIFLHIARPDFSATAGCIAVQREILIDLLPLLGIGSTITIG